MTHYDPELEQHDAALQREGFATIGEYIEYLGYKTVEEFLDAAGRSATLIKKENA